MSRDGTHSRNVVKVNRAVWPPAQQPFRRPTAVLGELTIDAYNLPLSVITAAGPSILSIVETKFPSVSMPMYTHRLATVQLLQDRFSGCFDLDRLTFAALTAASEAPPQ